jgi:hypothetical protein
MRILWSVKLVCISDAESRHVVCRGFFAAGRDTAGAGIGTSCQFDEPVQIH